MILLTNSYFAGIIFLISPLIIFLLNLQIYLTWCLIITWHIVITLPILNRLSKTYNWGLLADTSNSQFRNKSHPFFLLTIALGILYPLIWGLFFSLSRFFRLGTTYNIISLLFACIDYFILAIFILPCLIVWCYLCIVFIKYLKNILWQYTESLAFSLHLMLLQYYDYFFICKLMHKSYFILNDLFTQYPGSFYRCFDETLKKPFLVQLTQKLRTHYFRLSIHFIMFSLIILEIVLTKGNIYFGLYILFIYPLFWGFINIYFIIGKQNLIYNMCLSDYLYLNFKAPRYYMKFWFYTKNPNLWFNFEHTLPVDFINNLKQRQDTEIMKYIQFTHLNNKLAYYIHGYKALPPQMRKLTPKKYAIKVRHSQPLGIRIAANYKIIYGVKWYHSTRVLCAPKNLLHPFTAKFITDPFALLALLNKPQQNYTLIQQISNNIKHWPKPQDLYKPKNNIQLDDPKTLTDVLEANFVMRFNSLATNGVILGTYKSMKSRYGYSQLETMQMRPDMISNWINNTTYLFKGYLGIDEKHKSTSITNQGRHQVLNAVTKQEYMELLNIFEQKLAEKGLLTDEIRAVLSDMTKSSSNYNFDELLKIWADNLHVFPNKWKPPLMIEKTFDDSHLTEETLEKIRKGEVYIQKISDQLYTLEAMKESGQFSNEALDLFEGSIIQIAMDSTE